MEIDLIKIVYDCEEQDIGFIIPVKNDELMLREKKALRETLELLIKRLDNNGYPLKLER